MCRFMAKPTLKFGIRPGLTQMQDNKTQESKKGLTRHCYLDSLQTPLGKTWDSVIR